MAADAIEVRRGMVRAGKTLIVIARSLLAEARNEPDRCRKAALLAEVRGILMALKAYGFECDRALGKT